MASPPKPPTPPAVQVRQYSCHPYTRKRNDLYDKRREFIGANRQTNRFIPSYSQQEPPVARTLLMSVVRRVEKSERSKGKKLKGLLVKGLPQSREKTMTSLGLSRQKSEEDHHQYSIIPGSTKCEKSGIVHMSSYKNDEYPRELCKTTKEEEKAEVKCSESMNYDVRIDDVTPIGDGINRTNNINKPIARKRYARKECSLAIRKRVLPRVFSMCNKTWIHFALILVIVASAIRGGTNVNSPERLRISGLSSVIWQECETTNNSHGAHHFYPRLLKDIINATTSSWFKLGSPIPTLLFCKRKRQLPIDRGIFKNTISSSVTILTHRSPSRRPITAPPHCYATRSLANVYGRRFWWEMLERLYIFVCSLLCCQS